MRFTKNVILYILTGILFTSACGENKKEMKDQAEVVTNEIKTVKIGDQVWTAENFSVKTDSGSWCYNDDESKAEIYGRLYNWDAAVKICPDSFRLPAIEDWNKLIDNYGTYDVVAPKLKSTQLWSEPSKGNQDQNSMGLLPGGLFNGSENFFGEKFSGYYWTASEAGKDNAYYVNLDYDKQEVLQEHQKKSYGFSVRYIKK